MNVHYFESDGKNEEPSFFQLHDGVGRPTALHSKVKCDQATPIIVLEKDDILAGTGYYSDVD